MAYTVAQAEVTVTPNARNFGEDLKAVIGPQADAIGREAGDRIGKQIQERVRLALAELPDAKIGVDTKASGAEVDRFVRDVDSKVKTGVRKTGDDSGGLMAEGFRLSFLRNSPLIAAAVAGGLIAGAPLVIAAGGVLMGGLAAAIQRNNPQIQAATASVVSQFSGQFKRVTEETVPFLQQALLQVAASARSLADQAAPAFAALGGPIQNLTNGVLALVHNAMPGLVAAVQAANPVFKGLADLLGGIGSGLSDLFSNIAAHAGAAGQVFSSLGSILHTLLDALGTLAGVGAELGATILPPLAAALQVVASALKVIAPVLPAVAAGFLAFKAAQLVSGWMLTFATNVQYATIAMTGSVNAGTRVGNMMTTLGRGFTAATVSLGVLGSMFAAQNSQINSWSQALLNGGQAAAQATAEMKKQETAGLGISHWLDRAKGLWNDGIAQLQGYASASDEAAKKAQEQYRAMTPLQQRQQDVTKAQNDLNAVLADPKHSAAQAATAARNLSSAQARLAQEQNLAKAATDAAAGSQERNASRLQLVANAAGEANSEINLLKGALDALTGKAVSVGDAEVRVGQAVNAAKTALQGQTGALIGANGQLDLTSSKGQAAWQALTQLKDADNTLIATLIQHGATADQVSAKDDQLRAQFIKTAEQMGLTAGQAKHLADEILGIPSQRKTEIKADVANALSDIDKVRAAVAGIPNRTVYVNTVTNAGPAAYEVGGGGGYAKGAIVHAYAGGGLEPMPGGIASIVPPQTFRVIGDRVTDDEAYIPINSSARSLAILAQTAGRMGYGLRPASAPAGAGKTDARNYTFNISAPSDPKAIARQIRDAQRDLEFLHG